MKNIKLEIFTSFSALPVTKEKVVALIFARVINAHPNLQVILTADDPNYEDPKAIAEEIASQVNRPLEIEVDREKAIAKAMSLTQKS